MSPRGPWVGELLCYFGMTCLMARTGPVSPVSVTVLDTKEPLAQRSVTLNGQKHVSGTGLFGSYLTELS